jgi:hypothetical protein
VILEARLVDLRPPPPFRSVPSPPSVLVPESPVSSVRPAPARRAASAAAAARSASRWARVRSGRTSSVQSVSCGGGSSCGSARSACRAVQRSVPGQACRALALPKAGPAAAPSAHYRLRYDHVDAGGKVSIRRAGRMHHLGVGIAHRGKGTLAVTDTSSVTVIELRTGEVLSVHDIDPARDYWRNRQRSPGRWPGLPVT